MSAVSLSILRACFVVVAYVLILAISYLIGRIIDRKTGDYFYAWIISSVGFVLSLFTALVLGGVI